jgi:hypothetical protein
MPETPSVIHEILNGDALSLSQAARKIPPHRGDGNHAHPSCIWRWIVVGAKGPNGDIVKLDAARLAGRWCTSAAALARFFEVLTPSTDSPTPPTPARTASARRKAIEAAKTKLAKAGC